MSGHWNQLMSGLERYGDLSVVGVSSYLRVSNRFSRATLSGLFVNNEMDDRS